MNLYCSLALAAGAPCRGSVGDLEPGTPVPGESPLEYHPRRLGILTCGRYPAQGPCQVGSLTGAVAS